jgi:hypothetical protein
MNARPARAFCFSRGLDPVNAAATAPVTVEPSVLQAEALRNHPEDPKIMTKLLAALVATLFSAAVFAQAAAPATPAVPATPAAPAAKAEAKKEDKAAAKTEKKAGAKKSAKKAKKMEEKKA